MIEIATEQKVRIAYDGEALHNGTMDINDFAPALLAFGKFVQRVNSISGSEQAITVKLKADDIRRGSFDVSLILEPSVLDNIKLFLNAGVVGIPAILQVLGYISGFVNIYELIRKLHGKKISKVEKKEDGNIQIEISGDSNVVVVPVVTYNVFKDYEAREAIEGFIKPLKKEGVDSFAMRKPDELDEKTDIVRIPKDEVDIYDAPEDNSCDEDNVYTNVVVLRIVAIVFDENQKWRFNDGDGVFWAKIEDSKFWQEVENEKKSFGKGDRLKVECTITQHTEKDGTITTTKVINKVLEHLRAGRQITLDFEK